MALPAGAGSLWAAAGGSRERVAGVPPTSAGGEAARVLSGVALCASPVCTGVGAARVCRGVPQEVAPRGQGGPGRRGVGGAAGPNKGLQATANSLRSCLAAALGGA